MDILNTRSMEITTLAMDGLAERQKALVSNIANAETPGYKRVDVVFEDQLEKIIFTQEMEEGKKLKNSAAAMGGAAAMMNQAAKTPLNVNHNAATMQISDFKPKLVESKINAENENGNTVDIEREMSMLTKNGMTYNALAAIQAKAFRGISEIIKA